MEVQVLTDGQALDALVGRAVHWYGGPLAADRVADGLGLGLLEPSDDWLVRLPEEFTARRIELTTLSEAWALRHPVFVKPPSEKSFPAAVYVSDRGFLARVREWARTSRCWSPNVVTFFC
ncbi:hypothetical protein QFZ22_005421 [Streptomyces canus]|uniref:ATP-grasp domain-containing protein n=2 Tax=Streptomyces canus TaxID=58343 RepID=A0AAW8FH13_9ACTN|nr:ATP-grasp domain-containing protein [Streptomyces canus]MDQ0909436.1 hypothetical protein [Streptomyces canus]